MIDWDRVYRDVEDRLAPQLELDAWERTVYYHLLRHTRLEGKTSALFSIGPLSLATPLSEFKVRDVLRSLDRKGCTRNLVTRRGYEIEVLLPDEIPTLTEGSTQVAPINVDDLDFFSGRFYVRSLLEREGFLCFYCLARITEDSCELDHVVPQMDRLDNSYRNIVVSCHACNRKKSGNRASDFVRALYRQGLLGDDEVGNRLKALERLSAGELIPKI